MTHNKTAVLLLFILILAVSVETGNAWKLMKHKKTSRSNHTRKVKRAFDQEWVDKAKEAGCIPHQEPCTTGAFCCPATNGRFGVCGRNGEGRSSCEYVIVKEYEGAHGPIGLD